VRPDYKARNYLPTDRKPTIFPVPCRQAVYIAEYAEASAENKRVLGKKLSSTSHSFSKMIRQVDEFLAGYNYWQNRLVESHPEVAFQKLNVDKGLRHSKHTEAGIQERIAILQRYGVDPVPLFTEFTSKQYEDVLDALCLAVSAKLGCENGFQTIPANPTRDSRGLKMQMVFGQ
jgi:predicted RNase H-like nuclease